VYSLKKNLNEFDFTTKITSGHSMARANLNKSVWLVTNTTTASKYTHKRTRICINWTQIYLVKVPPNVNIVKQDLLNKKQFLKILWSEVWERRFQLIEILVLLGMYFDAVVVFVTSQTLLFRLTLAILWQVDFFSFVFWKKLKAPKRLRN
jgi:hypothetical protein